MATQTMVGKRTKGKTRDTVAILDASIENIRNGLWTCGELASCRVTEGDDFKLIGCALGLVGINAGEATIQEYTFDTWNPELGDYEQTPVMSVEMFYPAEGNGWRKAAKDAVHFLATTTKIPVKAQQGIRDRAYSANYDADATSAELKHAELTRDSAVVIAYNDGQTGKPIQEKAALNWFQRARDLAAQEAKAKSKKKRKK